MITCDHCHRSFGGQFGFDRHINRKVHRCRRDSELRRRGLTQRADGVWVRTYVRQLSLLPSQPGPRGRGGIPLVRRMFGKGVRDLTPEESRRYQRAKAVRRQIQDARSPLRGPNSGAPGGHSGVEALPGQSAFSERLLEAS